MNAPRSTIFSAIPTPQIASALIARNRCDRPLVVIATALLSALGTLGGCGSTTEKPELSIASDEYSDAIAATRDVLRSYRFQIDRVDAAEGVVTTAPKSSSGLATPWDAEQSSFNQELEDLGNMQERRVRVTFDRATTPDADAKITARVEVVIDRVQRPGWRPTPKSVRHSTVTMDPDLAARQMWPTYSVPIRQDPEFASEIAGKIGRKLGEIRGAEHEDTHTER